MVDEAKVKYICDIYDWDGKGEIDLFFLGDVMYALGLNITKKVRHAANCQLSSTFSPTHTHVLVFCSYDVVLWLTLTQIIMNDIFVTNMSS